MSIVGEATAITMGVSHANQIIYAPQIANYPAGRPERGVVVKIYLDPYNHSSTPEGLEELERIPDGLIR
jgi:hypothetical protein